MAGLTLPAFADNVLAEAKSQVAAAMLVPKTWAGPTSGPKAVAAQHLVLITDGTAQGAARFTRALQDAASAIGWQVSVRNIAGNAAALRMALEQAIIDQPHGIFIFGFDPTPAMAAMKAGAAVGVKFVGVESGSSAPDAKALPYFAKIGPSQDERARLAANAAITFRDGHAGAVILTDSSRPGDVHVARLIELQVRKCTSCKVLSVVDVSRNATVPVMKAQIKSLQQLYGSRWNVTLAPSDRYFRDFGAGLARLGLKAPDWPAGIAAGEGSAAALKRIAAQAGETATLARPLTIEAWQAIDEMNRALAGNDAASRFAMPALLVNSQNASDPALAGGTYDPALHYRHAYQMLWAK
ncbi:MAG: hypothetical protein KGQ37_05755 [Hyphomicrobiales bacterium]|nr:hypothetical protein [Hyphomicrobiales bacterium]